MTCVERDALISDCGAYRYVLGRRWGHGPTAAWMMLNPSVDDAVLDDPTVKRVVGFSQREGMGAARIVNLFSFRTPHPTDLLTTDDPVGPETDTHLTEVLGTADLVVVAWGDSAVLHRPAGEAVCAQYGDLSMAPRSWP